MAARKNPTTLYLIRHGEVDAQFRDCYYGQCDVTLSERGMRQSREIAERLKGVPLDAVYSSDLGRAAYCADLIAEQHDLPVRRLDVFRERHMGILQGIAKETLESDHAELFGQWRADRVNFRVPEAENMLDLRERVMPAIRELVASYTGLRVAVVCHAGPIRVIVAEALGMPIDHVFRLTINHCSINVIEYPRDEPARVMLVNG